ncbi:transcriptional regulator, TetR family [Catenulispora acidiphila DSM 44928]|uniref:Transcriptional regulator, TetR family n=1 Tax=Catenulispora acidiphila (strain DSM 44928 / JCM 14897 / NBRC 102108 / NRRL B-24433 / ID139908) TaxID=479433 RepID=C7QKE1_CATAD|nr:transcriptional regulator, TetR family [Catenulispora acidiphila DSM 44928]
MSPRRAQSDLREALLEAAARILAQDGSVGLSTRRLAKEVGSSTMAVYTHFGSMDDLVRAVVHEGFARLNTSMIAIGDSADPVADVVAHGRVYRWNAHQNADLYQVMLGSLNIAGFSLTDADRLHGRYVLDILVASVRRCMAAGRFQEGDPELVAHLFWTALHGIVTLELGGYLFAPYDADACFEAQVHSMIVGIGDDSEDAWASMRRSVEIVDAAGLEAGEQPAPAAAG